MANFFPNSPYLHLRETVELNQTYYFISDGQDEIRFTRNKGGIFCTGCQKAMDVIYRYSDILLTLGITPSAINVMTALAENQGNLDAVHILEDSYLTFGMFQWSVGPGSDPGQLAALLTRVKDTDPHMFHTYYCQYGMDVHPVNQLAGYLSLGGEVLKLPRQKSRLRSLEWGYHFWKSAQEPLIQAIQIQQALCRIDTFYHSHHYAVHGHLIADLITSEYGVALVLDQHINRPGYVKPCLEEALKQSKLPEPNLWGTIEEMHLLKAYLAIRAEYGQYPMTHVIKHAEVTKKYLDNGTISAERDSFNNRVQNLPR